VRARETDRPEIESLQVGRRDHYQRAAELVRSAPRRVVLSQRSSTLLLGPELGWAAEAEFFEAAWTSLERGTEWFHLASPRGIADHLARATSRFPHRRAARGRLSTDGAIVGLPHAHDAWHAVKNIERAAPSPDLKLDRQARLLVADLGDDFTAIVVEDVGDQQVTLHLGGGLAAQLFDLCLDFWLACPPLSVAELDEVCALEQ
jgi:hypothetical protein